MVSKIQFRRSRFALFLSALTTIIVISFIFSARFELVWEISLAAGFVVLLWSQYTRTLGWGGVGELSRDGEVFSLKIAGKDTVTLEPINLQPGLVTPALSTASVQGGGRSYRVFALSDSLSDHEHWQLRSWLIEARTR